ncbi:MAG: hypothetical protein CM15mP83_8890 [Flavobacteriaceae bacterium]|nr:MAG: hypothetical protein CM15mP83_8890 [Flavobacteriaceae bacterium]
MDQSTHLQTRHFNPLGSFLFFSQFGTYSPFELGHKAAFLYIKLLFESCFRSYKDFIYDVTLDPSMLDFLNLALSQKDTPDENYAREVQELFTVGKRPLRNLLKRCPRNCKGTRGLDL